MKKKLLLLTLFSLAPLISSCRGVFISAKSAQEVVDNLVNKFSDGDFDYPKFTYTYEEKTSKNTKKEIKVIYDRSAQFYYSYEIDYSYSETNTFAEMKEIWKYAREVDGEKNIYVGERLNGANDENGFPAVNVNKLSYSDEDWNIIQQDITSTLNAHLSFSLDRIQAVINYFDKVDDADIYLSSFGDYSILAHGVITNIDFSYQIDDSKLGNYELTYNENNYRKFSCDYERAIITYLNV